MVDGPNFSKLNGEATYESTRKFFIARYFYTIIIVAAAAYSGRVVENLIGYRSVGFIFLLAVIVVGLFGSISAVIVAASLSTLLWDYYFIPPKLSFAISKTEDFLMCIAYFVVALTTGFLTSRIRFHERIMREREERTSVLYDVLQDIANASEKSDFLSKVTARVGSLLRAKCGVIVKSRHGKLEFDDGRPYSIGLDEKDKAVAHWCFERNEPAGWSTESLSQLHTLFLPLKGVAEAGGVFVFAPYQASIKLDLEQENLLLSIVRQLGISIERHFLTKRLAEAQRLKDSEDLHQTLLNSISHEMRTPLTAIIGAAYALDDEKLTGGSRYVKEIVAGLREASDRLNRVIENLLDMSRLNSGVLSLKLEWHDFNDLLSVVVKKLEQPLFGHKLKIEFDHEMLLLKIDYRLMEHALSNLILNATMYTAADSHINISFRKSDGHFVVEIEDNGPGIPEESIAKIFDKFYRVPGSRTGGTGLGLSIVKSIVELHKGSIAVHNVKPHGARFTVNLPIQPQPQGPEEKDE
jgi:two-component system, OmpR family, sensor histidine kinase KdpD